jgi:hypothetical protein
MMIVISDIVLSNMEIVMSTVAIGVVNMDIMIRNIGIGMSNMDTVEGGRILVVFHK